MRDRLWLKPEQTKYVRVMEINKIRESIIYKHKHRLGLIMFMKDFCFIQAYH